MILGNGIDIIEIERIERAINRWGDMFTEHVFTPDEIEWARKHKFPYPHYAGRFAAKEAIFKALGDPRVTWLDLNIYNDPSGKPICNYSKNDFKDHIHLSISHTKIYAVAQAIVTR
jgi:holo-[acyl-carrier protein] synthase